MSNENKLRVPFRGVRIVAHARMACMEKCAVFLGFFNGKAIIRLGDG